MVGVSDQTEIPLASASQSYWRTFSVSATIILQCQTILVSEVNFEDPSLGNEFARYKTSYLSTAITNHVDAAL